MTSILTELLEGATGPPRKPPKRAKSQEKPKKAKTPETADSRKVKSDEPQRGRGRPALEEPRTSQVKSATTEREKEMFERYAGEHCEDSLSNVIRDALLKLCKRAGYELDVA